jgi:hypothetical protein
MRHRRPLRKDDLQVEHISLINSVKHIKEAEVTN